MVDRTRDALQAVDRRLEAPAQRILQVARRVVAPAHCLDATGIVLEHLAPAVAFGEQGLDVAPNPGGHSGDPNHDARLLLRPSNGRWDGAGTTRSSWPPGR